MGASKNCRLPVVMFLFAVCCSAAFGDRETALRQLAQSRQKYTTPETWAARQNMLRETFLKGVGLWPLPVRPAVKAIINERRVYDDYSVENVALETLPGFYCTGNLYRPVGRKDLSPIVLCPHGHFRPLGRFREDQQIRCAHFARMGATVFSYSLVGWQDSTQTTHDDPLVLALQTWNSLRAVDFLTTLPRIDATRIGVTGASGGGTQAMYLSLIDDRVTALAPLVIIYPWTEEQACLCEGGLPIMKPADTNAIELAAACAPKPQLLISVGADSTKDFPVVGFPFMQHMYALASAKDAVANIHLPDEEHDFGITKRKAVYEFFARHLRLVPNEFDAPDKLLAGRFQAMPEDLERITIEPPDRMTVFTQDNPLPADAIKGSEAVGNSFRSHLAELRELEEQSPAKGVKSRTLQTPDQGTDVPRSPEARPLEARTPVVEYSFKEAGPQDESLIFTPPGFDKVGVPKVAQGSDTATLNISVRDSATGQPTHCRINVVGSDGNYYEPEVNEFKAYSFTGVWPTSGWGNRVGKAPVRYLGRFFYSGGTATVVVPAGTVRVEVWKGFEFAPVTLTTHVTPGDTRDVTVPISQTIPMAKEDYWSGDPHIHIQRLDEADDDRIFGLMQAEDIHYGSILAYNEPAGPYSGFMKRMDAPQNKGTGLPSTASRGSYVIQSGQEYRSSSYGHINFYLLDQLVMNGHDNNADNWPPFGHVSQRVREGGGVSFYAHGGYAKEIYADVVQGNVDGVELLQFGVYRGIGLTHWYHMLNTGFRVPAMGACDYPACRKLGDCKTYVYCGTEKPEAPPTFEHWTRQMAAGQCFFTNGPMVLFSVNEKRPGEKIEVTGSASTTVMARVRVRSDVAPVTNVQLIGNGRILHEMVVPKDQGKGNWLDVEIPLELTESTWVAARAFSLSALETPDAEAHTNPVYFYLNEKAPYERESLDVLVTAIDSQIDFHKKREFAERAQVIAYFEKSRDILMQIRENSGASSHGHPSELSVTQAMLDDPGKREHTDEELREFLKPLPAKSLAEVMRSFETVDGFEMQLVASEPLVNDPVAACFDEDGNLYVCEMRDYPYKPAEGKEPLGTLRLLKDTDGDGNFDDSHIFADNLLWAGGVAPWKGGVYVAAAPDIWYLKDTDGDNKADVRRKVYTGFGTGNQQAMLNNLTWWLDHRIYGSTAGNGGDVHYAESPLAGSAPISVSGRDFRFSPADDRFESITGTVQFGTTFDDWGNRFLCSESRPLLHTMLPQHYLERNPWLPVTNAIHDLTGGPVPCFRISPLERWRMIRSSRRIAHGARSPDAAGASHHVIDAAAGVTVYRGGAYPAEYYGNVFVGGAQENLIHRRQLIPDGASFSSRRADDATEFVRSSDNWFRPVNFINAPDGTLYVLDMSREILETIHVPLDVTRFIDFKSGRQQGRIYRIAPPGFRYPGSPSLSKATTAELVQHLTSPHGWYRDTAHRLLFERQDPTAIAPLQKLLRTATTPQAKVHALWALDGLLAPAADKSSPPVRRGALSDADLMVAAQATDPRVREQAIRLAEPRLDAVPELLTNVADATNSDDARLRLQAAFSLGESGSQLAAQTLSRLARHPDSDPWLRTAVLSSSSRVAVSMFSELVQDKEFAASPAGTVVLSQLVSLIGSRNDPNEMDSALLRINESQADASSVGATLLATLGHALRSSGARFRETAVTEKAAALLRKTRITSTSIAQNRSAADTDRVTAIDLLSCWPYAQTSDTFLPLTSPEEPETVQLAAIDALATFPDEAIGKSLITEWSRSAPAARERLVEVTLSRASWIPTLLDAIRAETISPAVITPAQRDRLSNHAAPSIRSAAAMIFGATQNAARVDVIQAYSAAINSTADADAASGAKIFARDCSVCHRVANVGHAIGPDLESSPARDPLALLTHILDPNKYLLPKYETYIVIDTNGRTHNGLISAQTANSITLSQQEGRTETILRANIDEQISTGKSLMPEGFEKKITTSEMAQLIAYLQSVAVAPTAESQPLDIGTLPGLIEPES
jgi:putative membrane-bound dehydrogenase-like protein